MELVVRHPLSAAAAFYGERAQLIAPGAPDAVCSHGAVGMKECFDDVVSAPAQAGDASIGVVVAKLIESFVQQVSEGIELSFCAVALAVVEVRSVLPVITSRREAEARDPLSAAKRVT